jgi:hypothetical protein
MPTDRRGSIDSGWTRFAGGTRAGNYLHSGCTVQTRQLSRQSRLIRQPARLNDATVPVSIVMRAQIVDRHERGRRLAITRTSSRSTRSTASGN